MAQAGLTVSRFSGCRINCRSQKSSHLNSVSSADFILRVMATVSTARRSASAGRQMIVSRLPRVTSFAIAAAMVDCLRSAPPAVLPKALQSSPECAGHAALLRGKVARPLTGLPRLPFDRSNPTVRDCSLVSTIAPSINQASPLRAPLRDRLDTAAADGYYQATKRLELYGRFALRFAANGQPALPFVSTLTYLTQVRSQYRLTTRVDWAAEMRSIIQPSSHTRHSVYGTELGLWVMPDLRVGLGYNFMAAGEPTGSNLIPRRSGFYFTISSKLSSLFDLFGTSKEGLARADKNTPDSPGGTP